MQVALYSRDCFVPRNDAQRKNYSELFLLLPHGTHHRFNI
jgi:hypothetical protein